MENKQHVCLHGTNLAAIGNTTIIPKDGVIHWHYDEQRQTAHVDKFKVIVEITKAFQAWEAVLQPIKFEGVPNKEDAEIILGFYMPGDPALPMGFGEDTIAYNLPPLKGHKHSSDMFINESKTFSDIHKEGFFKLVNVICHELGHGFGLGHSSNPKSIMYDTYVPNGEIFFDQSDINSARKRFEEVLNSLIPIPTNIEEFFTRWLSTKTNLQLVNVHLLRRLAPMLKVAAQSNNSKLINTIAEKLRLK